jgi:hypothetical protein
MSRIRDIRLIPLAYHMPQAKAYGMARRLQRLAPFAAPSLSDATPLDFDDGVRLLLRSW